MAAWSWVAGALGEECTLVIVGGDEVVDERVDTLGVAEGVEQTIRWIERVSFAMLPALYRGAGVLMSAGSPSTGQELRWALACGLPIAAIETPKTAAVVGGAAYLIHSLDTRALGAACLTVVVNADVADDLRRLGLSRAGAYHDPSAQQAWTEALRSIVNSART
jgi:hypothetical protein